MIMQPSSPETTLIIILGASEFPHLPLGSNMAFRNSAADFKDYLLDQDAFGLPDENLLCLFDSSEAVIKQNDHIKTFLQKHLKGPRDEKTPNPGDLIIYYVGHGDFCNPNQTYFLALRATEEGNESISGYPIHTLAKTLNNHAAHIRRYLILDCCFSAAALKEFQSAPLQVAVQKIEEVLPSKGTSLLCAASATNAAISPSGGNYTMFSGALLRVLKRGSTKLPERLSLSEIGQEVHTLIREKFRGSAVRPEVHSPDQTEGKLELVPLFPNLWAPRFTEVWKAFSSMKTEVSNLIESQKKLEAEYSSVNGRLDALATSTANTAQSQLAKPPEEDFHGTGEDFHGTGLTRAEWQQIPGNIKNRIFRYQMRRRNGRNWLALSLMISAVTWSLSSVSLFYGPTHYMLIGDGFIAVCGGILAMLVPSSYLLRRGQTVQVEFGSSTKHGKFEDLDIVVKARNYDWCRVCGLEIEKNKFVVSQMIYFLTFIGTLVIRVSSALQR